MEWTIKYHKNARRFLENLDKHRRELVLNRLNELKSSFREGIFPIRSMDIKKLKGKWRGFFRLRVGEMRVIFRVDISRKEILVYNIHFRGRVYQ